MILLTFIFCIFCLYVLWYHPPSSSSSQLSLEHLCFNLLYVKWDDSILAIVALWENNVHETLVQGGNVDQRSSLSHPTFPYAAIVYTCMWDVGWGQVCACTNSRATGWCLLTHEEEPLLKYQRVRAFGRCSHFWKIWMELARAEERAAGRKIKGRNIIVLSMELNLLQNH